MLNTLPKGVQPEEIGLGLLDVTLLLMAHIVALWGGHAAAPLPWVIFFLWIVSL